MSKTQQLQAITTVAQATMAGERDIDTAIVTVANLISVTTEQATAIALPPYATQPALDELQAAINAALDTRKAVVKAHQALGRLAGDMGFTPRSLGDLWPCPKFPSFDDSGSAGARLRVVPEAA
jgi:hypothetical protein